LIQGLSPDLLQLALQVSMFCAQVEEAGERPCFVAVETADREEVEDRDRDVVARDAEVEMAFDKRAWPNSEGGAHHHDADESRLPQDAAPSDHGSLPRRTDIRRHAFATEAVKHDVVDGCSVSPEQKRVSELVDQNYDHQREPCERSERELAHQSEPDQE